MSAHSQLEQAKSSIPDDADVIVIGLDQDDALILTTLEDTDLYAALAGIVNSCPPGTTFTCKRCHHSWISRRVGFPTRCGNLKCQTPYWNKKKERE